MKITEAQFRAAAEALLPKYIMRGHPPYTAFPYRLDAHGLMGGSWRISYHNGYLDSNVCLELDEQWDDPLDCIKAMMHSLHQRIGLREITEQEFEAATLPFNKNAGLKEVAG